MRHFLIGAMCGAAAGGLVVHLWMSRPVASAAAAVMQGPSSTPASCHPAPAAPPPAPAPTVPVAPPKPPACPLAPATTAGTGVTPTALPSPSAQSAMGRERPASPIPLSAEHATVLTTQETQPTLPELHARLLAEPKDATWGPSTEDMIRRDLSAANDTGEFDIPTIECRETLCEVLAFGNAPTSPMKWSRAMGELRKPWEAAGLMNQSSSISGANGRYVIVTILDRRRKP